MAANKGVSYAINKTLADYLKQAVTSIQAIYDDFPSPSQVLRYPSVSIFTRSPNFKPGMPYVINKTQNGDGSVTVRRCIGIYEFRLQIDVWCSTKFDRHALQEAVFQALNPYPGMGLNRQLADYYGEFAHFSMDGFEFVDNGKASQRNEWRVRFDVVADVKAISEAQDVLMTTIENNLETPGTIPSPPMEQDAEIIL